MRWQDRGIAGVLGLLICWVTLTQSASAGLIYSDSFESPDVSATGFVFADPPGWFLSTYPGGFVGTSRPGDFYTGGNFNFLPAPADGAQAAFLNFTKNGFGAEWLFTAFPVASTQAGTKYTFSAALGHHNNTDPGILFLQIYAGADVVTSNPISNITPGTFEEHSVSYLATTTGAAIYLAVVQTGTVGGIDYHPNQDFVQASVDAVQLTAVPEPTSLLIFCSGALVLVRASCRSRIRRSIASNR